MHSQVPPPEPRIVIRRCPAPLAARLAAVWDTPVHLDPVPARSRDTVVYVDDRAHRYPPMPGCLAIMARASEAAIGVVASCGAHVVVLASEDDATLRLAWAAWRGGARLISPAVTADSLHQLYGGVLRAAGRTRGIPLTDRESEVLEQLLAGKPNADIAAALSIRRSTVETHVRSVLRKSGVADRLQLALSYLSGRPAAGAPRADASMRAWMR